MKAALTDLGFSIDGALRLTVETREDIRALYDELKGAPVTVEVKRFRQRRSLDSNAYAWALIDKLAQKMNTPKADIYHSAVRNIGGNNETVCVQDEAVEKLRSGWSHNGLGWITDTMPSKIPGCTNVVLYYGSSTYDTTQMSRLIDGLVQDCKAVGIETLPPDKLAAMMEEWA